MSRVLRAVGRSAAIAPKIEDDAATPLYVQTVRGWWRNRVARVLLNFFLTSLGTAIGVWTGGLRMLGRLFG